MKSLFLFSERESFLHGLDPLPKFVFIFAVLTYVILFENPYLILAAFVAIIFIIWIFGSLSPFEYWRVLLLLMPIIVAVGIIQSLTFHPEGTAYLLEIRFLRFSEAGAMRGVSVGARLATMALSFMLFSMTTTPKDVGLALHRTGVPYRYAFLATMGLRFLPLMQEDMERLQNARAARGDPNVGSKNIFRRMWSIQKSIFPLAATSLRQSNEIATAIELRGYGASETRTTVDELQVAPRDYAVIALSVIIIIAVVYLRFVLDVGQLAF